MAGTAKPLAIAADGTRLELGGGSGSVVDPSALGIDVARFLQGINSVLASSVPAAVAPSPVDALEQAVVQPNTGDTSRIVFTKTLIAYPGGAYEQLVTSWLTKSATPDSNGLVGLGQSVPQAAATIVSIRAAALAITP